MLEIIKNNKFIKIIVYLFLFLIGCYVANIYLLCMLNIGRIYGTFLKNFYDFICCL